MKTINRLFVLFFIMSLIPVSIMASESLNIETTVKDRQVTFTQNNDNRITVSVRNGDGTPVIGLTEEDFNITDGLKKIKILSVDPLHTDLDIPLNLVIVIDNSLSMKNRNAITPLLEALDEYLKVIRPIDHVTAITFSKKANMFYGKKLNLRTIGTTDINQLKTFFEEGFSKNLTTRTYLYDAVSAGMDILKEIPESEHNILTIFTDGADNNSKATPEILLSKADGMENFETYIIDYAEANNKDPFFSKLAEEHTGNVWKADESSELIPIFKQISKLLLYKYVITYRYYFPPKGSISLNPDILNFDTIVFSDDTHVGNKLFFHNGKSDIPDFYEQYVSRSDTLDFNPDNLSDIRDRYSHFMNLVGKWMTDQPELTISLSGYISQSEQNMGYTELSLRRAEMVKQYLTDTWEILPERIQTMGSQTPEQAQDEMRAGGVAENQYVEMSVTSENFDINPNYTINNSFQNFSVNTVMESEYGIQNWSLILKNENEILLTKSGTGPIEKSLLIPQNAIDDTVLKSSAQITADITFTDAIGNELNLVSQPCEIAYTKTPIISEIGLKPSGTVRMEPEVVHIDEITTIDTSPMLNFIYFDEGSADLKDSYLQLSSRKETADFRIETLRGSDEKYYNILNIIGKRLTEIPEADITITGCNSNYGPEKNDLELSYSRALEVKSYLKYIWGIESSRMNVRKQNLPDKASTNRNIEGRSENQRVEITSENDDILDMVLSTYIERTSNAHTIEVLPEISCDYGIKDWELSLRGDGVILANLSGENNLKNLYYFDLGPTGIGRIDSYNNLSADLKLTDLNGNRFTTPPATAMIKRLKREEMIALKIGQKITEKYALILFDFNQSALGTKNKVIIDKIVARIKSLPDARVKITGYTDSIGKREYNVNLSKKRAESVYKMILKNGISADDKISVSGNGPDNAFYDNTLPEGRALNRTVIIHLEYEKQD